MPANSDQTVDQEAGGAVEACVFLASATTRRGMFVLKDGRNVAFTFMLLILLLALWGFCNGVIDVMDKHFQTELGLTLAQSAWVQFAHYLGYFPWRCRLEGSRRS
jgi:hypothetical protein